MTFAEFKRLKPEDTVLDGKGRKVRIHDINKPLGLVQAHGDSWRGYGQFTIIPKDERPAARGRRSKQHEI